MEKKSRDNITNIFINSRIRNYSILNVIGNKIVPNDFAVARKAKDTRII